MMQVSDASHNQKREFRVTGRFVLLTLVGFFAVVFAVNGFMAYMAQRTFSGVQTDNAYKLGLKYNDEISASHNQAALGWRVEAALSPVKDAQGSHELTLSVRDKDGQAINDLEARAHLINPTHGKQNLDAPFRALGNGQFRGRFAANVGQWNLIIELYRGDKRVYRSDNRIALQ